MFVVSRFQIVYSPKRSVAHYLYIQTYISGRRKYLVGVCVNVELFACNSRNWSSQNISLSVLGIPDFGAKIFDVHSLPGLGSFAHRPWGSHWAGHIQCCGQWGWSYVWQLVIGSLSQYRYHQPCCNTNTRNIGCTLGIFICKLLAALNLDLTCSHTHIHMILLLHPTISAHQVFVIGCSCLCYSHVTVMTSPFSWVPCADLSWAAPSFTLSKRHFPSFPIINHSRPALAVNFPGTLIKHCHWAL